jgi:hypothetical protein
MKSELRLKPHKQLPNQNVIEIWYDGEFIGTVVGNDGPGVRVISKYEYDLEINPPGPTLSSGLCVVNVCITIPKRN